VQTIELHGSHCYAKIVKRNLQLEWNSANVQSVVPYGET
jgi:hypothetical protein